jgi:hypothetical protein
MRRLPTLKSTSANPESALSAILPVQKTAPQKGEQSRAKASNAEQRRSN